MVDKKSDKVLRNCQDSAIKYKYGVWRNRDSVKKYQDSDIITNRAFKSLAARTKLDSIKKAKDDSVKKFKDDSTKQAHARQRADDSTKQAQEKLRKLRKKDSLRKDSLKKDSLKKANIKPNWFEEKYREIKKKSIGEILSVLASIACILSYLGYLYKTRKKQVNKIISHPHSLSVIFFGKPEVGKSAIITMLKEPKSTIDETTVFSTTKNVKAEKITGLFDSREKEYNIIIKDVPGSKNIVDFQKILFAKHHPVLVFVLSLVPKHSKFNIDRNFITQQSVLLKNVLEKFTKKTKPLLVVLFVNKIDLLDSDQAYKSMKKELAVRTIFSEPIRTCKDICESLGVKHYLKYGSVFDKTYAVDILSEVLESILTDNIPLSNQDK